MLETSTMTRPLTAALAVFAVALFIVPARAAARTPRTGELIIRHPWIRPTPNAAPTAAGYLTVTNHGKAAERLLSGTSPDVQAIEPHTMSMNGGVMRMRLAAQGFVIPPGATLILSPGGDHLMLVGPRRAFKVGDHVPATLRFARAGDVKVDFEVRTTAPAVGGAMPGMNMR
jgi:copper(I)-binding protein